MSKHFCHLHELQETPAVEPVLAAGPGAAAVAAVAAAGEPAADAAVAAAAGAGCSAGAH